MNALLATGLALSTGIALAAATTASADVISQWNFNGT